MKPGEDLEHVVICNRLNSAEAFKVRSLNLKTHASICSHCGAEVSISEASSNLIAVNPKFHPVCIECAYKFEKLIVMTTPAHRAEREKINQAVEASKN